MATSSRRDGGRLARYLGSTKNLTGSVLAVAAVAAELVVGLGDLWPLAVAGAYGVGALVAPPERAQPAGPGSRADLDALRADLTVLDRRVREVVQPNKLLRTTGGEVLDRLWRILGRPETLARSVEGLFVVTQTIRDYLPTSLEAYLNLPFDYLLPSGRTARAEFAAQLALLRDQLDQVLAALYAGDAQALIAQGRFLEEMFRGSAMDL